MTDIDLTTVPTDQAVTRLLDVYLLGFQGGVATGANLGHQIATGHHLPSSALEHCARQVKAQLTADPLMMDALARTVVGAMEGRTDFHFAAARAVGLEDRL